MSISLAPFCKMASASAYTSMYFHSLGGSIKLLYHMPDGIYNLLQLHCSRGRRPSSNAIKNRLRGGLPYSNSQYSKLWSRNFI